MGNRRHINDLYDDFYAEVQENTRIDRLRWHLTLGILFINAATLLAIALLRGI